MKRFVLTLALASSLPCLAQDRSTIYRQAGADVMRYAMAMPASLDAADLRMIHRAVVLQGAADAANGPQSTILCSENALALAGRWGAYARANLAAMADDAKAAKIANRYPDARMIQEELNRIGRSLSYGSKAK